MDSELSVVDACTRRFEELREELNSAKTLLDADDRRLRNALRMEAFLRAELDADIKAVKNAERPQICESDQLYAHFGKVLDAAELMIECSGDFPGIGEMRKLAMDVVARLIEEFKSANFANPVPRHLLVKAELVLEKMSSE
ncbi:hypothetical protein QR680_018255 [Steinernema hermaphroditum]|uniref:Uncharacterized protein n=1 Tax=Steinernema hermaphroditum TaxID=289476 RepID=A0AA39LQT9_9BILA|nr:hypothetical protein QR680_018255 [Steinernema hermaphroditum]